MATAPKANYRALIDWLESIKADSIVSTPTTPEFLSLTIAVKSNIQRLVDFGGLAATATAFAGDYQRAMDVAQIDLFKSLTNFDKSPSNARALVSKTNENFASVRDTSVAQEINQMDGAVKNITRNQWAASAIIDTSWGLHSPTSDSVIGMMESVIVSAWTIYETLAGDLWELTLNSRPTAFHLGTLIRAKFNFQTREGVIAAYRKTFATDADELQGVISSTELRVLSAFRNAIVHNAGVVDVPFLEQVKGTAHAALPKDSHLPINGPLTAELANSGIVAAARLIDLTDKWVAKHAH